MQKDRERLLRIAEGMTRVHDNNRPLTNDDSF
jgi:hypothetical protein